MEVRQRGVDGLAAVVTGLSQDIGNALVGCRQAVCLIQAEKLVDYTYEEDPFARLLRRFGAGVGEAIVKFSVESGLRLE